MLKIKLSNIGYVGLFRILPASTDGRCIIDTGATCSMITKSMLSRLTGININYIDKLFNTAIDKCFAVRSYNNQFTKAVPVILRNIQIEEDLFDVFYCLLTDISISENDKYKDKVVIGRDFITAFSSEIRYVEPFTLNMFYDRAYKENFERICAGRDIIEINEIMAFALTDFSSIPSRAEKIEYVLRKHGLPEFLAVDVLPVVPDVAYNYENELWTSVRTYVEHFTQFKVKE